MIEPEIQRPDPDVLLERLHSNQQIKIGRLKIFLGYAAGVGKTYSMLDDAHEKLGSGIDVVVGYVEPHTRPETIQLLEGLPVLPPKEVQYRNLKLKEFDLDAALERNPELILVDELAHTNAPGMRNKKRYQDIEELLNAGIDVYTTINIQHFESLNDIVQKITNIKVKETVPDTFFEDSDTVELIDFSPEELLKRFEEGKIYRPERAETAMQKFFTKENLQLLRELAMRKAADRLSHYNENERQTAEKVVSTKLLACISSSPDSAKLIRWTARTAEAFHAPWVAVYVDTMSSDNENEVQANLDLAKRLGAETVRLNGLDVAATVADYAGISGITNIVIGKIRSRKSLKNFFERDLEDRLVSLLPDVEIHIIPGAPQKLYQKQNKIRLTENLFFSWIDTVKTVAILVAATLLNMGLQALGIGDQNLIMVYILSVLVVSRTTMGYLYGMAASILSVLAFNFFFTVPYYTFNAIQPGYPITFVIMFLAAFITSTMTVRIKTQVRISVEREHRIRVLYEINKKLLSTRGLENIVKLTNEYITKIFDRSVVFYTEDPDDSSKVGTTMKSPSEPDASYLNKDSERAVAHWVFLNKKRAGASTDTLMGADAYYVPMISQTKVLGVIGVSCVRSKLETNSRLFLRMLASLAALALERQYISDEQRGILIEAEKEKMRSDMLRMAENLLSANRINEGTMNVEKTPEAVKKIIAEAVGHVQKRFPERQLSVRVPDESLSVPMDCTLIIQVLLNLIENAFKRSSLESAVTVEVKKDDKYAIFEVCDQGENGSDPLRGTGIGLSLCMSIIKGHNGVFEAQNKKGGGTVFRFKLPLK